MDIRGWRETRLYANDIWSSAAHAAAYNVLCVGGVGSSSAE
jgi:hypothetical protein